MNTFRAGRADDREQRVCAHLVIDDSTGVAASLEDIQRRRARDERPWPDRTIAP